MSALSTPLGFQRSLHWAAIVHELTIDSLNFQEPVDDFPALFEVENHSH